MDLFLPKPILPSIRRMYVGAYVVKMPEKIYKTAAKLKLAFLPYL